MNRQAGIRSADLVMRFNTGDDDDRAVESFICCYVDQDLPEPGQRQTLQSLRRWTLPWHHRQQHVVQPHHRGAPVSRATARHVEVLNAHGLLCVVGS